MIQAAVDMMPFDAGNKMRNGAAVAGWSLLGESAETTRIVLHCIVNLFSVGNEDSSDT